MLIQALPTLYSADVVRRCRRPYHIMFWFLLLHVICICVECCCALNELIIVPAVPAVLVAISVESHLPFPVCSFSLANFPVGLLPIRNGTWALRAYFQVLEWVSLDVRPLSNLHCPAFINLYDGKL